MKDNSTKAQQKITTTPNNNSAANSVTTKTAAPPINKKSNTTQSAKNSFPQKKAASKADNNTGKQDTKTTTVPPSALITRKPDETVSGRKNDTAIVKWEQPNASQGPIPKVLLERENNLIKTIYTNEKAITVEIFDNGTIDNDTISLYHNNKLAISQAKLTYTPLRLKIDCSGYNKRHELILVAENLGEIPPNSALMVITSGKKRYEVFLISNEQRNAKVVIEYRD